MELIITDTGSTDGTVEIAKKYADKYLEFEWCDDFSAGRNVSVEAAEGAWFMYHDADEIFEDDSVVEIAKFINSPVRDDYDCGSIITHDLHKNSDANIFHKIRLFNFTAGKRKFINALHEAIPCDSSKTAHIGTHCMHYGYIDMDSKTTRNAPYLEQELKKDPNNYRNHFHYVQLLKPEERIEFCEKTIKHFKDNNNPFDHNISIIFYILAVCYFNKKDTEKLLALKDEYFSHQNRDFLPNLDVNFLCGLALYNEERYQEAIPYFQKYQEIYVNLSDKFDDEFSHSLSFHTFNELTLGKSLLFICLSLAYLNQEKNAKVYLLAFIKRCGGSKTFADDFLALYLEAAKFTREIPLITEIYKSVPYKGEGYAKTVLFLNSLVSSDNAKDPKSEIKLSIIKAFSELPCDVFVAINRLRLCDYTFAKCSVEALNTLKFEKEYIQKEFIDVWKLIDSMKDEALKLEEALSSLS